MKTKKKIKKKIEQPDQAPQNLSADEALALNHTPGAVLLMKKLARLILAGYQLVQAAQRLKRNYHYVLTVTALPEFKTYLAELEADYFAALDRKIKGSLGLSIDALIRQLRHPDWRARDSAIEKVLRLHGRYIDRIDVRGSLSYSGQVHHQHDHQLSLDDTPMTEELRLKAREVLALVRQQQQPKALPPRFTDSQLTHQSRNGSGLDDDEPQEGDAT